MWGSNTQANKMLFGYKGGGELWLSRLSNSGVGTLSGLWKRWKVIGTVGIILNSLKDASVTCIVAAVRVRCRGLLQSWSIGLLMMHNLTFTWQRANPY